MISSNVGGFCHQTWGLDHGVDTWKMVVSLNKLGKGWEHWERNGSWNEFWVPWGTVYSHNFPYIYHIFTNERLKNMKVRCGDANHILERPHELDSGELISGKVEGWKLQKQLMKAMQKKRQLNGLSLSAFRGVPLALWISSQDPKLPPGFLKIGYFAARLAILTNFDKST